MPYTPLIKKISSTESSALRQYQNLFVGSKSWLDLLKYELLTVLFSSFPGAFGYFCRCKFFPLLFKKCGNRAYFGRNITIRAPKQISLGSNIIVDDNAVLDAKGDPKNSFIKCGNEVEISRNTILSCKNGTITIGNFVSIGRNVLMSSVKNLTVGNNCNIGPFACILASGHGWDNPEKPAMLQNREIRAIEIDDNVWIGAHVTIMDGVKIGKKSIISVGSVVTNDIPPYSIAAGVPARVISKRNRLSLAPEYFTVETEQKDINLNEANTRDETKVAEVASKSEGKISRVLLSTPEALDIVFSAIDILNEQLPENSLIEKNIDEKLYETGGNGKLDSLGLLNLIVAAEEIIQKKFSVTISLSEEQAEMQLNNSFGTVESLAKYIELKIKESAG